eukprot:363550-Chlamydomonas_euryale.AAC.10
MRSHAAHQLPIPNLCAAGMAACARMPHTICSFPIFVLLAWPHALACRTQAARFPICMPLAWLHALACRTHPTLPPIGPNPSPEPLPQAQTSEPSPALAPKSHLPTPNAATALDQN